MNTWGDWLPPFDSRQDTRETVRNDQDARPIENKRMEVLKRGQSGN